jgi:hypothetical protein
MLLSMVLGSVVLGAACSWVSPDNCWRNSSDGFGGGGPIPIGAGVGATSGAGALGESPTGGVANPCVAPESSPGDQGGDTCASGAAALGTGADVLSGDTSVICGGACSSECVALGVGSYSPTIFKFMTTIPAGSKTKPGGWQVASTSLRVRRWTGVLPEEWTCPPIWVGMPVQTEAAGPISPQKAADLSAQAANDASNTLRDMPQGVFCSLLASTMTKWFVDTQPLLGARVTKEAQ